MAWIEDLPLKRKLTLVILGTCAVVLLLASAALAVYETLDFRRALSRDATVMADIFAQNSQAALSFADEGAATALLRALQADANVEAARLFDRDDKPFATYVRTGAAVDLPAQPEALGHRYAD